MLDEDGNVTSCSACPKLVECRSRIVNGVGPTDASLLLVGEAPGKNEDDGGEPFVGRSGTLLTETLNKNNISRDDVRITNCVRCRPPNNRNPTDDEMSNCQSYIHEEIEIVEPSVILGLGRIPSEALVSKSLTVTKDAGTVYSRIFNDYETSVVVGLHPAFILRDSSYKDTFEEAVEKAIHLSDN